VGTTALNVVVDPDIVAVSPLKLTPEQLFGVSVTLPVNVPVWATMKEAIVAPDWVDVG
jgi:hypothetical protein